MPEQLSSEEFLGVITSLEEKRRRISQNIRAKRHKIGVLKAQINDLESEKRQVKARLIQLNNPMETN
jgi:chromosome segregation ATPase